MEQRPNYYSVMPANVRYDRSLTPSEKLMFSEITALANKQGYCHAKNGYFSELYSVAIQTVSRWISHLEQHGYIEVKIIYKGKQIVERRIFPIVDPINKNVKTPKQKYEEGINKNVKTPINKNVKDNNTSINTTSKNNTSKNIYSPAEPDKFSEQRKTIIGYLNERLGTNYKPSSAKTKRHIDARLNEGYELDDFKRVINNKISDWANDSNMVKYLRPETLFGTKFESYLNQKKPRNALLTGAERNGHYG